MEYPSLGKSGAVVSTPALGTMTFGRNADEAASHTTEREQALIATKGHSPIAEGPKIMGLNRDLKGGR